MKKTFAIAGLVLLFASACSSSPPEGDRPLVAETPGAKGGGRGKGKGSGRKESRKKDQGRGSTPAGGDSTAVDSGSTIAEEVDVPGADEEQQYPTGSVSHSEPNPDGEAQGITPSYAEMTAASIEGLGKDFRITMTFDGNIPDRMPNDKTIMVVGFQVIRGREEGYSFAGQATDKGWKAYAGGKNKKSKFPGSFDVEGNEIVMTVPWSFVEGAYPFKWVATANWFQSLANTTHYKFDLLPNQEEGQGNYPG